MHWLPANFSNWKQDRSHKLFPELLSDVITLRKYTLVSSPLWINWPKTWRDNAPNMAKDIFQCVRTQKSALPVASKVKANYASLKQHSKWHRDRYVSHLETFCMLSIDWFNSTGGITCWLEVRLGDDLSVHIIWWGQSQDDKLVGNSTTYLIGIGATGIYPPLMLANQPLDRIGLHGRNNMVKSSGDMASRYSNSFIQVTIMSHGKLGKSWIIVCTCPMYNPAAADLGKTSADGSTGSRAAGK